MYDIIIIGGGPAGLTAGIYALRGNKKVLLLEKSFLGGQMASTPIIENYPGFAKIDGVSLTLEMKKQALALGLEIKKEEVIKAELKQEIKVIKTSKNFYEAKCVIIASGAFARELEIENEKKFIGKGISYCASCDGALFKDKTVAIVGGGRTSIEDCFYLKNIVKKIYLIYRREEFSAPESEVNELFEFEKTSNGKLTILTNTIVSALQGEEKLNGIQILNKKTDETKMVSVDGLFVAIGRKPDTDIFKGQIDVNNLGYIVAGENTKTNIEGVFVCGDVRTKSLRQIATAVGDGAVAGTEAIKFLAKS